MMQYRTLATATLTLVLFVLVACSGPQALNADPAGDVAARQAINTRLSWSPGSAVLNGRITGLGGREVLIDGIAYGYYPTVCINTNSNKRNPQYNIAPGHSDFDVWSQERDTFQARRGAVKFEKGNYVIQDPHETWDDARIIDLPRLPAVYYGYDDADCPNDSNWIGAVDSTRFFITAIDLDLNESEDADAALLKLSWICDPALVTATSLGCTEVPRN